MFYQFYSLLSVSWSHVAVKHNTLYGFSLSLVPPPPSLSPIMYDDVDLHVMLTGRLVAGSFTAVLQVTRVCGECSRYLQRIPLDQVVCYSDSS